MWKSNLRRLNGLVDFHTADDDRTSRADAKLSKRAILLGGAVLNAVAVVKRHMILIEMITEMITVWILRRLLIIGFSLRTSARMVLKQFFRLSQASRKVRYALASCEYKWQRMRRARGARRGDANHAVSSGF